MTDPNYDTYRVFIGWDSRFPEPGRVLAYSLRKHASRPLDIRFLDLRHLRECYNFRPLPDPKASTEFTRSRFLVPWLCGYQGRALFLDNDMVCLADVCELIDQSGPLTVPLKVVQHAHVVTDGAVKMYGAVQHDYPRKNWSSLMLMNCSLLKCWTKDVVEEAEPARLHRFQDVDDHDIGGLDPAWNALDRLDSATKIIHYTSGGPWFDGYKDCKHADVWYRYRSELIVQETRETREVPNA